MKLLVSSMTALFLKIIGSALSAATLVLMSRNIGFKEVGVFGLLASLLLIGRYLGPFGYDQLILRTLSNRYVSEEEVLKFPETFAIKRVLIASLSIALVISTSCKIFLTLPDNASIMIAISAAIIYLASALSGIFAAALRSRNKLQAALLGDGLIAPSTTFLLSAVMAYWGLLDLQTACAFTALGAVNGCLWQFYSLSRLWRGGQYFKVLPEGFETKYAVSLWFVQVFNYFQSRYTLLFAASIASLSEVAIIEVTSKISMVPIMITWAIGVVITPRIILRDGGYAQIAPNILFSIVCGAFATATTLAIFVSFGNSLLYFAFGPEYIECYPATVIMLMAVFINGLFGVFGTFLIMNGHENTVSAFNIIGLLTGIFASYIFYLSIGGAIGISIGALASTLIRDIGLALYTYKVTPLYSDLLSTLKKLFFVKRKKI